VNPTSRQSCQRIAILSGGSGWHVRDLIRAAEQLGHRAEVLDFRKLSARVGPGSAPLDDFDAIIVRTMPPGSLEQVVFRMDLLHLAQARGAVVLNSPRALEICIDKYLATARLAAAGLPVPETIVCQTADDAMEAFESLGSDVVVKPLFGSEGRGMVRINDAEIAWRTLRTLERTDCVLYLQRFIRHPGWDVRVFVLGGEVRAGMRRHARDGWRTNVAQGGRAEPTELTARQAKLARRAAEVCGTAAAGIDILPDADGKEYILEVNAVPGWRALAPVTGVDVAAEMIRFVASEVSRS
jgi:ribosomal protein S6--L-glutamate ligase